MTDFEKQLVARMQAMSFLLDALLRAQFHAMDDEDAREHVERLMEQFAAPMRVPQGSPPVDVADLHQQHQDAQYFLEQSLRRVAPQAFD